MLKVGQVIEIYEMKGGGRSIRGIAGDLGHHPEHGAPDHLNSSEAIGPKFRGHSGHPSWTPIGNTSTVGCRKDWRIAWFDTVS